MKKISILLAIIGLSLSARAQQEPMYTNYMFNTLAVNPAYAGKPGALEVLGLSRFQWLGIDGAPTSHTILVHSPFMSKTMGLGLSVINDQIGAFNYWYIEGDYSYTLKVSEGSKLAFGLKAGLNSIKGDLTSANLENNNDMAFSEDVSTGLKPNFGFGLYYYTDKWYVGASTPKLVQSEMLDNPDLEAAELKRHYFLIAGYVFDLANDVKFKPSGMIKVTENAPLSMDYSANFLFWDSFWLGAAYRWQESIGLLTQFQLSPQLRFGYAYDIGIGGLSHISNGSHEFMLSYLFGYEPKSIRSPRYF